MYTQPHLLGNPALYASKFEGYKKPANTLPKKNTTPQVQFKGLTRSNYWPRLTAFILLGFATVGGVTQCATKTNCNKNKTELLIHQANDDVSAKDINDCTLAPDPCDCYGTLNTETKEKIKKTAR